MTFWTVFASIFLIFFLLWKYLSRDLNFFKDRGVPCDSPWPIIGNAGPLFFRTKSIPDWIKSWNRNHGHHKFFGVYAFGQPRYVFQDPDLIKQLGVKDFEYFTDHEGFINTKADVLFRVALLNLKGQKWKDMKSTLSPAFTGSKMRMMFDLIHECGVEWQEYFARRRKNGESPLLVDAKDICTKFGVNTIATCHFGLKVNALTDPENQFYLIAKETLNFNNAWFLLKMFAIGFWPNCLDFFGIGFSSKESMLYFKKIIFDTFQYRRANNYVRPDVIQLLMQAQEGNLTYEDDFHPDTREFSIDPNANTEQKKNNRRWTDDELASQPFQFLFGGYDATSTMMMYTAYEIARNRDVQDRLIEEIDSLCLWTHSDGDSVSYEKVQKLEFLDAVVSEVLRVYAVGTLIDRVCVKPYTLVDDNGRKLTIEPGTRVWYNVLGLHYNPKYFPNPEKFDPDRFYGTNKHKIQPNTYYPFGVGPRGCLGYRFALMVIKSMVFYTLSKFTFEVCDQTPIPLEIGKNFGMLPTKNIILEIRPRNPLE